MPTTQQMTDQKHNLPAAPSRQAVEAANRSKPGKVTGRLKVALDDMVWVGSPRADAAKTAGMTDHSLRTALTKPHVKAYYLSQLEVLRTSERARNIHALVGVRDQPDNKMARVAAVKALEQISDTAPTNPGANTAPGLVIVIQNVEQETTRQQPIDAIPLNSHGIVSNVG